MMRAELLSFTPQIDRATIALRAFADGASAAHVAAVSTTHYRGGADWLVLWGPGAPNRQPAMQAQLAAGGHVACLDLAYWNRDRKFRISPDAPHPQAWVMRTTRPTWRFRRDPVVVANAWNPDGPIVVAGIGRKALVQYGPAVEAWEAARIAACRARWTRPVVYRAKPVGPAPPIDRVLCGASLVITWHSNVAIDAIRLGIPVVCRDGAAASVCPAEVPEVPTPLTPDVRDRFLANLAWFQWAPGEAANCWTFLQELLT